MKPIFPEMPENKAFALELPKWPQFLMTGKDLSPERALEIIFLSDEFVNNIGMHPRLREHGIRDEICDQFFARVKTWVDSNKSRIEKQTLAKLEELKKSKKT